MSSSLSARERKHAHAIAERYGLMHQSSNLGGGRALLLAKDATKVKAMAAKRQAREAAALEQRETGWAPGQSRIASRTGVNFGQLDIAVSLISRYLGVDAKRFTHQRLGVVLADCLGV